MHSGYLAVLVLYILDIPDQRLESQRCFSFSSSARCSRKTPLLSKRSILSIQSDSRILIVYYIFSEGGRCESSLLVFTSDGEVLAPPSDAKRRYSYQVSTHF